MTTIFRTLCTFGVAAAAVLSTDVLAAQSTRPTRSAQPVPSAERDSLEGRVRQRMSHVLKTQLGLTDDQMRRLQSANGRFEVRRRELVQQERDVRSELRLAMRPNAAADSAAVSTLLDRMIAVQRQRVELMETEQRELATFLTPLQRARYFGMEEQIRRRVMEMRENGRDGQRRPGPPNAPRGDGRRPAAGNRLPG